MCSLKVVISLVVLIRNVQSRPNGFGLKSTGQIAAGMVFCDGVVLGADETVNGCWREEVLRELCENTWTCGIGLQAEADEISRRAQLDLVRRQLSVERVAGEHSFDDDLNPMAIARVLRALLKQHPHINSNEIPPLEFLLAGVHKERPQLIRIGNSRTGALSTKPWALIGPGTEAAMSQLVLAAKTPSHLLSKEKAIEAVKEAIIAATNVDDFASGARIHMLVLQKDQPPQRFHLSSNELHSSSLQ